MSTFHFCQNIFQHSTISFLVSVTLVVIWSMQLYTDLWLFVQILIDSLFVTR